MERQAEVMAIAREATRESRRYNRERLLRQANAKVLHVGDSVMVLAMEPLSLTAKWDYGFTVTNINGLVVTVLHQQTGVSRTLNRDKLKLTDPAAAWDDVATRPRRTRARPRGPTRRVPTVPAEPAPSAPGASTLEEPEQQMDATQSSCKRHHTDPQVVTHKRRKRQASKRKAPPAPPAPREQLKRQRQALAEIAALQGSGYFSVHTSA